MATQAASDARIYDAESGRVWRLEGLIRKLGMKSVAARYGVSESAVRKWLAKSRHPSKRTVIRPLKKLL